MPPTTASPSSRINTTPDTVSLRPQFVLTDNDTALVESWRLTETDLSGAGGSTDGWTWDCVFQELALGASRDEDELLFEWSALGAGVGPSESYFEVVRQLSLSISLALDQVCEVLTCTNSCRAATATLPTTRSTIAM